MQKEPLLIKLHSNNLRAFLHMFLLFSMSIKNEYLLDS